MKEGQTIWEYLKEKPSETELMKNSKIGAHGYFLLVTCTAPLVFIFDIIPNSNHSLDEQFWLRIIVVILFIEVMANWLCCQYVSTHIKGTRDRPVIEKNLWDLEEQQDFTQDPNYCKRCKLVAPYGSKTHHCKECNRCILRRDHHCYMVGTCIGYYNQRYFVLLTFYIGVTSCLGFYYCRQRILNFTGERTDFHWTEHVLPLTAKYAVSGRLPFLELVLVFYCYTFAWTTFMGWGFFFIQMVIISLGLTFHEFKTDKKSRQYRTMSENFMEVFGPCWVANFILPMQLVFKQKEFEEPLLFSELKSVATHNGLGVYTSHQKSQDHIISM